MFYEERRGLGCGSSSRVSAYKCEVLSSNPSSTKRAARERRVGAKALW
jgi:hypothetical protein